MENYSAFGPVRDFRDDNVSLFLEVMQQNPVDFNRYIGTKVAQQTTLVKDVLPEVFFRQHGSEFCCWGADFEGMAFVPFVNGKINIFPVRDGQYALSSQFSGCVMAKFVLSQKTYVCHVCLLGDSITGDCRAAWNAFVQCPEVKVVSLFYPKTFMLQKMQAGLYGKVPNLSICGIITWNNTCVSALMEMTLFRCVAARRHLLKNPADPLGMIPLEWNQRASYYELQWDPNNDMENALQEFPLGGKRNSVGEEYATLFSNLQGKLTDRLYE